MGLKKKNVLIESLGIVVPEAYAQIEKLHVDLDGKCIARFKVQTSRESMDKPALDSIPVKMDVDKTMPAHKQAYEYAKKKIFADWEDDIPVEE